MSIISLVTHLNVRSVPRARVRWRGCRRARARVRGNARHDRVPCGRAHDHSVRHEPK